MLSELDAVVQRCDVYLLQAKIAAARSYCAVLVSSKDVYLTYVSPAVSIARTDEATQS